MKQEKKSSPQASQAKAASAQIKADEEKVAPQQGTAKSAAETKNISVSKEETKGGGVVGQPLQNNTSATSVKHNASKETAQALGVKKANSQVTTKQVLPISSAPEIAPQLVNKIEKQSQSATQTPVQQPKITPVNSELSKPSVTTKKKSAKESQQSSQTKAQQAKEVAPLTVDKQGTATPSKRQSSKESKAAQKAPTTAKPVGKQAASAPIITDKDQLMDKWPNLQSAADWNREEKEREIRENLAKMAGILIETPITNTNGGKASTLPKAVKAKLMNQQSLKLEQQYQQQNFVNLTSFDANKCIRVGQKYQVTEYPSEVKAVEKTTNAQTIAQGVNPEEDAAKIKVPSKRTQAPEPAIELLSQVEQEQQKKLQEPQKRAKLEADGYPKLVSIGTYGEDSEELKEYLDLCDFIMREASSNLNGMLLRGSSQYQEKAMQILTTHNYNFDMAKFAILYPTVLLIPESRNKFLKAIAEDESLLGKIVSEAVMDLKGCKQDEIDEVVNELRLALSQRIKPEELKVFQRKFDKMQIKFPDDVEQMILDAEEFSKQVRKQINPNTQVDKRLTLSQLEELHKLAQAQCLETPELFKLDNQVANAHDWLQKVKQSQDGSISLKDLERLVRAGKQLPVKFGEPFEEIQLRLNKAVDLQKRIQATFKSNKTRGAVQGPAATETDAGKTSARAGAPVSSNHGMYQEQLNKDLQEEGVELNVSFKDLDEICDLIDRVNNWKHFVSIFLDEMSVHQQMKKRLKFKNYLNEAKQLKLGIPLVQRLQNSSDYIEWRQQVNTFWRQAIKNNPEQLQDDTHLTAELASFQDTEKDADAEDSDSKSSENKSYSQSGQEEDKNGDNRGEILTLKSSKALVQGLSFTLLEDKSGEFHAEKACKSKVDLLTMRSLIEEIISKGYFLDANSSDKSEEKAKDSSNDKVIDSNEQVGDEQDTQMKQIEEPIAGVEIDPDSGKLQIDENLFKMKEKPYTVQLLLLKYTESRELSQQIQDVVQQIEQIEASSTGVIQLLTARNEASFELNYIKDLHKMWTQCSNSIVRIPQISDFFARIQKASEKEDQISKVDLTDINDIKEAFSQIFACSRTGIKTQAFASLYEKAYPLQIWCNRARHLVKDQYKAIDIKHNQLKLIDSQLIGKPFDSKNPFNLSNENAHQEDPVETQLSKKSQYKEMRGLMMQVNRPSLRILQGTNEYVHLKALHEKIEESNKQIESLTKQIVYQQIPNNDLSQVLNRLDSLLTSGVPLDPDLHFRASKLIKLEKWKLRLSKLRNSKQVTVKQIESLIKESKSSVVQDDKDCKSLASRIEQQHQLCKDWLEQFESFDDFYNLEAVTDLIDRGSVDRLGFVLEEYTQLKEDHYEALMQIKNGQDALFDTTQTEKEGQATHDTLKILIILKQEMIEREIDSKDDEGQAAQDQQSPSSQTNKLNLQEDVAQSLSDLLEQKGNDIELLQSMDSLVDVWRTIGRRALTVAVDQESSRFTLTLRCKSNDQYELVQDQMSCGICQSQIDSDQTHTCVSCQNQFHTSCLQLRQIGQFQTSITCFACLLKTRVETSSLQDQHLYQRNNQLLVDQIFLKRRQRLSIEQLSVLIEVADNLLPTVYLPELEQLRVEHQRALKVQKLLNQVSSSMVEVSDVQLTSYINQSETLIVDMNKQLWQAVSHTQQLHRLAAGPINTSMTSSD